jgi:hypothetical protein
MTKRFGEEVTQAVMIEKQHPYPNRNTASLHVNG